MDKELIIKRCKTCGTVLKVFGDDKDIKCCGNSMETLVPNSVDAAVEKHVPTYEKVEDKVIVKVNHVMEEQHYIEWICLNMYQIQLYMHIAICMDYGKQK